MERESVEKGTFPQNELKAAYEGLFALKRESLGKWTFSLKETRTADGGHFALGREILEMEPFR